MPKANKMPANAALQDWLSVYNRKYLGHFLALFVCGTLVTFILYYELELLSQLVDALYGMISDRAAGTADQGSANFYTVNFGAFLQSFGAGAGRQTFFALLLLYCGFLSIGALIEFAKEWTTGSLTAISREDIEREVLANLLRQDDEFFRQHAATEIANRLTGDAYQIIERRNDISELWFAACNLVAPLIYFLKLDWRLALIGFGVVGVGAWTANRIIARLPVIQRQLSDQDDRIKSVLGDYLNVSPEVQVSNLYAGTLRSFTDIQKPRRQTYEELIPLNRRQAANYKITNMAAFAAFITALVQFFSGQVNLREVPVIIRTLPSLFHHMLLIARLRMQFRINQHAVDRLMQYASPAPARRSSKPKGARKSPAALSLSNVKYRFGADGQVQGGQDGVNVSFKPRTLTAIIGGSGSGKSMLSQLMLGRKKTDKGTILYAGTAISRLSPEERARIFSYMPQTSALVNASIKGNLLFGCIAPAADNPGHAKEKEDGGNNKATSGFSRPLTGEELAVIESIGLDQLAMERALDRKPIMALARHIDGGALHAVRRMLQEEVEGELGLKLHYFRDGRAALHHPVVDHILGGVTQRHALLMLQQKSDRAFLDALAGTAFADALSGLALRALKGTRELLSRSGSPQDYNGKARFPLSPPVWMLRKSLLEDLGVQDQANPQLMLAGLLTAPAELEIRDPARLGLARNGTAQAEFIGPLKRRLAGAVEPFDEARILGGLNWRDNLLFAGAPSADTRIQRKLDRILLANTAASPLRAMLIESGLQTGVGRDGRRLSGGQRQLVCLGRTLLRDAETYLLDEPTSALDLVKRWNVNRLLQERAKQKTVIAITHDLDLAKLADQVVVMKEGAVHATGKFSELFPRDADFRATIAEQPVEFDQEPDAKFWILKKSNFFGNLPVHELHELAEMLQPEEYAKGETVCTFGEPASEIFLIMSGGLDVYLPKTRRPVRRLHASDMIGEYSLFADRTSSATVKCAEDSVLLPLAHDRFRQFLDASPSATYALLRQTVERLLEREAEMRSK